MRLCPLVSKGDTKMKIFDFIKKIIEKNQIKQTEDSIYEKSWREMLHYEPSEDDEEEDLEPTAPTEEQLRSEQIEYTSFIILNREELQKEGIIQYIQKKYENILLNDADIQSLIAIYHSIEYEDAYGNYNIREFIEDDEKNIVKLVDELVLKAKEEAEKHKSEEIGEFVIRDFKLIGEIKDQIENDNEREFNE